MAMALRPSIPRSMVSSLCVMPLPTISAMPLSPMASSQPLLCSLMRLASVVPKKRPSCRRCNSRLKRRPSKNWPLKMKLYAKSVASPRLLRLRSMVWAPMARTLLTEHSPAWAAIPFLSSWLSSATVSSWSLQRRSWSATCSIRMTTTETLVLTVRPVSISLTRVVACSFLPSMS